MIVWMAFLACKSASTDTGDTAQHTAESVPTETDTDSGGDSSESGTPAECPVLKLDVGSIYYEDAHLGDTKTVLLKIINNCEAGESLTVRASIEGSPAFFLGASSENQDTGVDPDAPCKPDDVDPLVYDCVITAHTAPNLQTNYLADDRTDDDGTLHLETNDPNAPTVDLELHGQVDPDGDGDDHLPYDAGGDDCNDEDATIHPDAAEAQNLIDEDCDGLVDEDFVAYGDVFVTEILADPAATDDALGEYLEVTNGSDAAVDLVGWVVESDDGDAFTVATDVVIEAGGSAVLAPEDDVAINGGVAVDATWDPAGFSLDDSEDTLALWVGDVPVFDLSYNPGWPLESGGAMGVDPASVTWTSAAQGDFWCAQTSVLASGDRGTPGESNDPCP